jgi:outer membrane protein
LTRKQLQRHLGSTAALAGAVSVFVSLTVASFGQAGTGAASAPGSSATGAASAPGSPASAAASPSASQSGSGQPSASPTGSPSPISAPSGATGPSSSFTQVPAPANAGSVVVPTAGANGHYDLSTTIALALQASSDLAIANRNVDIDRKRSGIAAAAGNPKVNASGSATRFDAPTTVAFGGKPFTVLGNNTQTLALGIAERIDITGEIHAAASQENLQSIEDGLVARQIANQRILTAQTTYYNLLRAEHQVAVAEAALATAQTQETNAVTLNEEQVGQKIDVLRANTQVATAQQQLDQANANLGIAREDLNNVIGKPIDAPAEVDDVPGVTVGEAVTSATNVGAPAANVPLFTPPTADVAGTDMNQGIATANTNRPEVLAAEVGVRVAQTGVKLARSGLEPTLDLAATGDYYPTTSFEDPRQRVAAITATLTVPLWDGGATRDSVAEAKLQVDNAQSALDSQHTDVALDVGQAYLNLTTAASQIDSANTALQEAIAARQLAQIRYEGQVALYLEVTDAQSALVAAENNQVNAVYDYLVARARYQNAIGVP